MLWYSTEKSFESLVALITGVIAIIGQASYQILIKTNYTNKNSFNKNIGNTINNFFISDSKDIIEKIIPNNKQTMNNTFNFDMSNNNQSGGVNKPQVNIGSSPRKLDENLKLQLLSMIDIAKKVVVTSTMGDGEAFNFATLIKSFLVENGFTIEGVNQAIYSQPVNGQIVNPDKNEIIIGSKI